MDVLGLTQGKNRCLKRLLEFTEAFCREKNSEGFARYEAERTAVIKTLTLYDANLDRAVQALGPAEKTPELLALLRLNESERIDLVRAILNLDEQIVLFLADEKEKISRELTSNRKTGQNLKKFKSAWVPGPSTGAGERLDKKL